MDRPRKQGRWAQRGRHARTGQPGQLAYVADLAAEYGFTDADGRQVGNFYPALGLVS